MTQPEHDEPVVGGNGPPPGDVVAEVAGASPEHPVVAWARAILGGIGDTAREVLDEGRKGAQEAYDDGWRRFDDKTRFRRTGRNRPGP